MHRLDIPGMLAELPVDLSRDISMLSLHCDSLLSVAVIDECRKQLARFPENRTTAATDRVLFGIGPSPKPESTKIGGKPFRSDRPWPRGSDGAPLAFLMQLNMTESLDILGNLPGEILSVFVPISTDLWSRPLVDFFSEPLAFEWQQVAKAALQTEVPPDLALQLPEFWGATIRGSDYARFFDESRHLRYQLFKDSKLDDWEEDVLLRAVFRHPGTKIGGLPYWYFPENNSAPGRFVAAFGGVLPACDRPWPWLNRQEPISLRDSTDPRSSFLILDGGIINFFLDDGQVKYAIDFL
jgi:hypothetical protein